MIIYTDLMRHQRYCPVCPSEPNTLNNFQYQCECHLLSAFATNEMLQSSELNSENVQKVRFVSSSSHGRMLILQQHERTSGEKPWMMNTDTLIAHKKNKLQQKPKKQRENPRNCTDELTTRRTMRSFNGCVFLRNCLHTKCVVTLVVVCYQLRFAEKIQTHATHDAVAVSTLIHRPRMTNSIRENSVDQRWVLITNIFFFCFY